MASMQIRIYPNGKVQGEINGIKGKRCTDYISVIEELTSSRTWKSNFTEEFYETEEVAIQQEQQDFEEETIRDERHGTW